VLKSKTRRVIFQPAAYRSMQKGIDQIVNAIRPTLGPLSGVVAIMPVVDSNKMPEMLDNGGVIARRIIQLPDRDQDMGAMFIRHMLWRVHEQVGDGTATAAVLFQSIYNQGLRYITSGGNAMLLRRYLEKGMRALLDELTGMTTPVEGKEKLTQIANSVCTDPPLAKMLGEIFDIVGEYGRLEIRSGRSREIEREYVEGMYWNKGVVSREMLADRVKFRTELENPAILISDLSIEDPRQLLPLLERLIQAEIRSLLIVAHTISPAVIGFLLANSKPEKLQLVAVKTPGATLPDQTAALQDLAVLTGGRPVIKATKESLAGITVQDLGRARKAWADRFYFGINGGKGDPRALRMHISDLRAAFERTQDTQVREKIQERLGKLMGGAATLWVGGITKSDIDARKELAERTSSALRGAIREGVVPGGGVALLACRPALEELLKASTELEERAAYRTLLRAMEEPMRTIIANTGYDASEVMAEVRLAGPGHGFDATAQQIVDVVNAGILDVASVQKAAVHGAISSAALALTTDVLIHRKKPPEALDTA
jgi:chaperonin GroEL